MTLRRSRVNASAAVPTSQCPSPTGDEPPSPNGTDTVDALDILARLGESMPSLRGAKRTVAAFAALAESNGLLGAALLVNSEGETLLESLLVDVSALAYFACDGNPGKAITAEVLRQLELVARTWLREDVADATRLVQNGALHHRRMTTLRRVESLLCSPHTCPEWLQLARSVAIATEECRMHAGWMPMTIVPRYDGADPTMARLQEARARLLVRVTVEKALACAREDAGVVQALHSDSRHDCAAATVLVWVATTHGLRLFARQLLATQLAALFAQETARWSTAQEIATAMETAMLVALQRPAEFFPRDASTGGVSLLGPLAASFGVQHSMRASEAQEALVTSPRQCLDVVGLDVVSERERLRMRSVGRTITKTPYQSGLAAGLVTFFDMTDGATRCWPMEGTASVAALPKVAAKAKAKASALHE